MLIYKAVSANAPDAETTFMLLSSHKPVYSYSFQLKPQYLIILQSGRFLI
ncbi:hypothetical protein HMPREF1981_03593 [Bacteroides pyogenes F0041]|uniref:Uncharacterized protein n=1 Tax=Bacteroides pyogenes F0041 TaxID=1321819 RepID=U2C8E8_9BACE|nr:hypothetical protein HMPREF1981_03593 [Bacteroides pyogenes F0041]